ncbi:MAG: SLC13 family permease, partial [Deltaproteobacteria bacterium]
AVVALCLAAMVREVAGPDLIMMAGLFALAAVGILTPAETFAGFSNQALAAVGALFIVSGALRDTGAIEALLGRILGRARKERDALTRISAPVAAISAFLNNAPIVAMLTPGVIDWARRHQLSPSRFLIPLSYAAILGSVMTLIGTSVNLTVAGLILDAGMPPMRFFELLPAGLPICIGGLAYLVFVAPRWLPDRREPAEQLGEHRREYTASMIVEPICPLVGRSVEDAGLRQLPGLFLVEIDREGHVITPVGPDEFIRAGDRLVFAGVVSTIVDLQRIRGLVPAEASAEEPAAPGAQQRLIEAVVSSSSPLVNQSVRDANFRTVYDAAVVAVHRSGVRVPGKIGEIVLRPGDTLLLQTAPGFLRAHRNSPDFYLVSEIDSGEAPRYDRAWVAALTLLVMILVVTLGIFPISIAAFLAAGVLVGARAISARAARQSVVWHILIVIGAGLGIASAMEKTGAAAAVAHLMVATAGALGPVATLAIVYLVALAMAEVLHHNAAVAIMFPIAVAAANELGVEPRGFVMAIAIGSTCAFASPVTYQTHLIVYGPGGYRFADFVRVGLPLDLICAAIGLALIPWIWPF